MNLITFLFIKFTKEKRKRPFSSDGHKTNLRSGVLCHAAGMAYDPKSWALESRQQEKRKRPFSSDRLILLSGTFKLKKLYFFIHQKKADPVGSAFLQEIMSFGPSHDAVAEFRVAFVDGYEKLQVSAGGGSGGSHLFAHLFCGNAGSQSD